MLSSLLLTPLALFTSSSSPELLKHDHNFLGNFKGTYMSAKGEKLIIALYGSAMKGASLKFVVNGSTATGSSWEKQGHFTGYDKGMMGGVAQLSEGSTTLTGKLEASGIRWSSGELWRRTSSDLPKGFVFKKHSELKGALSRPPTLSATGKARAAPSTSEQLPPKVEATVPQRVEHAATRHHEKKESGKRAKGDAGSQELR